MKPTILGLGGSLRTGSTSTRTLHIALESAEMAGAHTHLMDLATLRLPLFDGTYTPHGYTSTAQIEIQRLLDAVEQADGIILASPTYHNTISGTLKNALDMLELLNQKGSAAFAGKVIGLVSVQGGTSGTGINTLTTMLFAARALGGWVSPTMVNVMNSEEVFTAKGLQDSALKNRLCALGAEVVRASEMFATHWRVVA